MPIYAYKCESCGHAKDVLQKISDTPLTGCPQCGVSSFKKQVTAAGFQLKGSGWYVTDFRGGDGAASASKSSDTASPASATGSQAADGGAAAVPASAPVAPSPAPAAANAGATSADSSKAA